MKATIEIKTEDHLDYKTMIAVNKDRDGERRVVIQRTDGRGAVDFRLSPNEHAALRWALQ